MSDFSTLLPILLLRHSPVDQRSLLHFIVASVSFGHSIKDLYHFVESRDELEVAGSSGEDEPGTHHQQASWEARGDVDQVHLQGYLSGPHPDTISEA